MEDKKVAAYIDQIHLPAITNVCSLGNPFGSLAFHRFAAGSSSQERFFLSFADKLGDCYLSSEVWTLPIILISGASRLDTTILSDWKQYILEYIYFN